MHIMVCTGGQGTTYRNQPGIGIKTDRRTNGTELKTWILIHKPSNTGYLTKKQKISNGEKKAYLTNGTGITGYKHVEE